MYNVYGMPGDSTRIRFGNLTLDYNVYDNYKLIIGVGDVVIDSQYSVYSTTEAIKRYTRFKILEKRNLVRTPVEKWCTSTGMKMH
jgi:hypothetical protein